MRLYATQLTERLPLGVKLGVTDTDGLATLWQGDQPPDWPWHILVTHADYQPELRDITTSGRHDVTLRRGFELRVEVHDESGRSVPDCPILVSAGTLADVAGIATTLNDHPWDLGDSLSANSAAYIRRTGPDGSVVVGGLAPGRIIATGLWPGRFFWKYAPPTTTVPETKLVRMEMCRMYALALRVRDDAILESSPTMIPKSLHWPKSPFMHMAVEWGRKRMGPGLLIPLVRAEGASEREVLAAEVPFRATLEKRGSVRHAHRPIPLDQVDRAETWDLSATPLLPEPDGELVLTTEPGAQSTWLAHVDQELVVLSHQTNRQQPTVLMRGNAPQRLRSGLYSCKAAMGAFGDRVEVPAEILVVTGSTTKLELKLRGPLVPVRLQVMNKDGLPHSGGSCHFIYPGSKKRLMWYSLGSFDQQLRWLPPGFVEVTVILPDLRTGKAELQVPQEWRAEPLECVMEIL